MSYKYIKDTETGSNLTDWILRKSNLANIRINDSKNQHEDYLEYKSWIDAGNTPEAAD